jgi:hypothetical protein
MELLESRAASAASAKYDVGQCISGLMSINVVGCAGGTPVGALVRTSNRPCRKNAD